MKRAKRMSVARNERKAAGEREKQAATMGSEMGLVFSSDEEDTIPEGTPPPTKSPKTPKQPDVAATILYATTCSFAGSRPYEDREQGPPQKPQERYFALTDQGNLALYSSEAMKDKPKTFPIKEADIMLDANDTHGAMLINKAEEICVYFGPREKPAVTKTAMTAEQKKAAMTAAVGTPRSKGSDAWKDDKRLPKIDDFGRDKDDPAYGKGCQDLEPILRKIRPKVKSRRSSQASVAKRSSQAAVSKKEPEPEPEANWLWDTMVDFVWSAMSVHGCKMGPMRNDHFNVEYAKDNPLVLDRLEGFTAQEVTYKHAWEPDSDEDSGEEQVDPGPQLMLEQCPKGCSVRKYGPRAKKAAKGEPGMQVGLLLKTVNKKPVQCFRPEMVKHVFKTEKLPLKLVLATQLKEDASSSDEEESSEEESSEDEDAE